jgi:hypothetical protein
MTRLQDRAGATALEERVVSRLRAERLIAPARSRDAVAIAAGLAILSVSLLIAAFLYWPQPVGHEYLLELYGGPEFRVPSQVEARAAEYGDWARAHHNGRARVLGGSELAPAIAILGSSEPEPGPRLLGFFRIAASNEADAVALAKTTPHLRYGGSVAIRPIVG